MTDPIQQKDEDIIIRTMKSDLEDLNNPHPKKEEKPVPATPAGPISQEAQYNVPQAPALPPLPKIESAPEAEVGPPILTVAPKIIPPKKLPEIPIGPLFKPAPVWIKIGAIALGVILIMFVGLYGYWKIYIQSKPPIPTPPVATTTLPTLPVIPSATTTAPIKFFKKLPNKTTTIDLPSKTPASLLNALKSEAAIEETIASVKQIKITYQGKPITAAEFMELMFIFTPKDFMSNYENDFALAYFRQKEGARPILILKTKNRVETQNQMKDWEAGTFPSDILPLFLKNFRLPKTLPAFKSYLFVSQPVRYLNISLPFASLNYAIYNDFLVFTTSSASMFVTLQDLTGQTVSQNYLENLKASINEFVR